MLDVKHNQCCNYLMEKMLKTVNVLYANKLDNIISIDICSDILTNRTLFSV